MSPAQLLAALLTGVVLLASLRLLRASTGDAAWRRAALLGLQAVAAVLLYFALLPPPRPGSAGELVVLTAGAAADAQAAAGPGDRVVALPEATAAAGVERVPDLGTALRRHPGATRLHVLGEGLPARDHAAARGLPLRFSPAPETEGLVELSAPTTLPRGRRFDVAGRVAGGRTARIELHDPAGRRIAAIAPAADGRFSLGAGVRGAGRSEFRLELLDAEGTAIESIPLPLQVGDAAPLRLLALAGGPTPELKYLRRWALDAGLSLHSSISLGGGVDLGDGAVAMTPARLAEFDLLLLDERAWRTLGDPGRAAVREAARGGLGVLLRLGGPLSARETEALADWGFRTETTEWPRSLRLPGTESPDAVPAADDTTAPSESQATDLAPLLTRRALRLLADDGSALWRDGDGEALLLWRAEGRGRIGVGTLGDSFRLVLTGRRGAYGELWGRAIETLARPGAGTAPTLPSDARTDERSVFCGLPADARVRAPAGEPVPLRVDAHGCAAWWPAQPGWHALQWADGEAAVHVRADGEARGLLSRARREATLALASAAAPVDAAAPPSRPGERGPWLLAWLLASAALWGLERSRAGRGPA